MFSDFNYVHFAAVQMLLGGLMVVPGLTLLGRDSSAKTSALAIARYGQALYLSSVIIGLY